jgi:F420-dependent oxidoreductase-like protein
MRVGLQLPWYDAPGRFETADLPARLREVARTAEDAGFASLWVMDHFFQLPFPSPPFPRASQPGDPMLESFSTLSFLAGATRTIKLGPLVTGVIYRHPGVLVKTATTLDVLSGGRSYFGIGAGWYEREARGLGLPFPPLKERFEQLEETLQIVQRMWAGDHSPYHGRHFQLEQPLNSPQPVAQPHPPIMIGGGGERKTLRLVAQYADACNLDAGSGPASYADVLDELPRKFDVLRRHCDELGRDFETIERTTLGTVNLVPGGQTADEIRAYLTELAGRGVQHAIVNMADPYALSPLETFGRQIIPELSGL